MGAYSELDMELRFGAGSAVENGEASAFAEDDAPPAFMEDDGPPAFAAEDAAPAFVEAAPGEADNVPPEFEAASPQDVSPSAPGQADGAAQAEPQDATSQGSAAQAEDEDARRKAHEESETQRKAEFDARREKKRAAEQAQIDKLNAMSDNEVLSASMQRISTDLEKLTRRNLKECVAEHIQTLCITDPAFARRAMHPRKSIIRCLQHISRKAWEYIQDELKANGIDPSRMREPYGSDVPDDLCYQWAEDYFNNPEAKEDHEDDEEFVPKTYYGGTTSKAKSGAKGKDKGKASGKKDAKPQKAAEQKPKQKPTPKADVDSTQLSLGGFMMPEEKAG